MMVYLLLRRLVRKVDMDTKSKKVIQGRRKLHPMNVFAKCLNILHRHVLVKPDPNQLKRARPEQKNLLTN